jgi:hypothetical protein
MRDTSRASSQNPAALADQNGFLQSGSSSGRRVRIRPETGAFAPSVRNIGSIRKDDPERS